MKPKSYILSLLIILITGLPAQAKKYTAKGSAMIINGDKQTAAQLAETAARKKALTNAVHSLIPEGSPDRLKFDAKKGAFLRGEHPFVTASKVTNETLNGQFLTREVTINVETRQLQTILDQQGILASQAQAVKKKEFPTVSVILSEEIDGHRNTTPYSEGIIRQALIDAGFDVVDDRLAAKSVNHDRAVQALLNNDIATAKAAALQFNSGAVIACKAVAQKSGIQSGGMQVQGANITLQAVEADTGRVLANASAEGHYPHVNALTGAKAALEEAAQKAAKDLLAKLKKSFDTTTQKVILNITNLNYKQLAIIKQILKRDFPQITTIQQRSFNSDIAKLDVSVDGSVTELIDKVALKNFKTFTLDVLNYSPGKIDLAVRMKAGK